MENLGPILFGLYILGSVLAALMRRLQQTGGDRPGEPDWEWPPEGRPPPPAGGGAAGPAHGPLPEDLGEIGDGGGSDRFPVEIPAGDAAAPAAPYAIDERSVSESGSSDSVGEPSWQGLTEFDASFDRSADEGGDEFALFEDEEGGGDEGLSDGLAFDGEQERRLLSSVSGSDSEDDWTDGRAAIRLDRERIRQTIVFQALIGPPRAVKPYSPFPHLDGM